jgi:hypothetical protein
MYSSTNTFLHCRSTHSRRSQNVYGFCGRRTAAILFCNKNVQRVFFLYIMYVYIRVDIRNLNVEQTFLAIHQTRRYLLPCAECKLGFLDSHFIFTVVTRTTCVKTNGKKSSWLSYTHVYVLKLRLLRYCTKTS